MAYVALRCARKTPDTGALNNFFSKISSYMHLLLPWKKPSYEEGESGLVDYDVFDNVMAD